MHRKRKASGFTLIELLVVIAVIAVLMATLMPALSAARKQAAAQKCMGHVRQLGMGMTLYTTDHDQKLFPFVEAVGEYWIHQLAPYLAAKKYKNNPEDHLDGAMKVAYCPTAKKLKYEVENENQLIWGSAHHAWRWMKAQGSYGFNCWLIKPSTGNLSFFGKENFFNNYTETNSRTPVLGDSSWVGSWPDSEDTAPDDLIGERLGYDHAKGKFMWRYCIDRHKNAINLVFADGHASRSQIKDLWNHKWHKNFLTGPMPE